MAGAGAGIRGLARAADERPAGALRRSYIVSLTKDPLRDVEKALDFEACRIKTEDVPPAYYVHLMDARFFNTTGNPIPGNRGVWWRARLAEVSGFSMGVLGAGPA
jgi:hypothetical protein